MVIAPQELKILNHTSRIAVGTPTERPMWVNNQSFGGVFMLSRCFLDLSVAEEAFVIGLSRIIRFSSLWFNVIMKCRRLDASRYALVLVI